MAETVTNRGKQRAMAALVAAVGASNFSAAVILGTQTGVNDPDLNTMADLDAVSGVSFHTERLSLASVAATEDDTNNRSNVDAANLSFAAAVGVTAQGIVIYDNTSGSDATRDIIAIYTTNFPVVMDGGLSVPIADFLRGQ